MIKTVSTPRTALIAVALFLAGCHGSDTPSQSTEDHPSSPTLTARIERTSQSEIQLGETYRFDYPLSHEQSLRVLEPPKYGQLVVEGNQFQYQASKTLKGTDQFRLEIISDGEPTPISWMLRVNGEQPRFRPLDIADPTAEDEWQCLSDRTTHLGVTWALPTAPRHQTFGWENWDANLANLEAQCFLGQDKCTTDALIEYANRHQWCGQSDWRLPYAYEMHNLTSEQDLALERDQAAIDPYFFPQIGYEFYWLATDNKAQQQYNFAHRVSFGSQNRQVSSQNKRRPASAMLVSGEARDPSLPSQQVEVQAESTSFIRLDDQGAPLPREHQTQAFADKPWRCLDDMRGLVRDNLYLRDRRFSYVYWLTPHQHDLSATAHQFSLANDGLACDQTTCHLETMLTQVNSANHCGRTDWRVPTIEELSTLLHQQVDGGQYTLQYQTSLNQPQPGQYWVKTPTGYATLALPLSADLSLKPAQQGERYKALLIATEFEPRATEDRRSLNNHGQPNMTQLRQAYSTAPANWPAAFVDDDVEVKALGRMPVPDFPSHNPYQQEKVALGQQLFFDPFLSVAQDVSCSSCHDPQKGWTDQSEVSIGHAQQRGKRNAPTIVNSAFLPTLFWDGRADDLEQQALMPIQDPLEMAESLPNLMDRLNAHPTYPDRFKAVFGEDTITQQQLAMALATFQRTIVSQTSRFDQFLDQAQNGTTELLSDQELWGLDIYRRNGRCMNCHMGPELTNHEFENVGLTYYKRFYQDLGQFNVDGQSTSVGKFKTPSLRDVMNTGPWFHNGLISSMDGVISMYSEGMASNAPFGWDKYDPNYPQLSDKIRPLNLTFAEAQALKSFMQVITADSPQQPASAVELGQSPN
ncbi:cytochrome c peroxidase [Vibrio ostreicida]|uniref:cytochrome c peroxidase n=1 Tax=Vibrio ostreicida TaxID=526588 RepID=UPI000970CA2B|nr:cytochrome c peroxidase [Vibrio ostreicida]